MQPTIGHRKTSELLVAAGGEHLAEAAGGLAGWAGAAVALEDLESQLAVWLPEGTVSVLAAAVTRRVLCDEAGLAATKWATHAVSVDALAKFTETAMAVADDVGLIDADALAGFAAEQGWAGNVELLVEACGFVRLFGRLAVRQSGNAACRAALLEMKHAATVAEIAELTGLTIETARKAVSGFRIGRDRYAAHTDARFAEFTAAVASVVDDVGLIDEAALREVGTASGWGECVDEFIHRGGYVCLSGLLALNDTSAARAKAALVRLGGHASSADIGEAAGVGAETAERVLRTCRSVDRTTCWLMTVEDETAARAKAALVRLGGHASSADIGEAAGVGAETAERVLRTCRSVNRTSCWLITVEDETAAQISSPTPADQAPISRPTPADVARACVDDVGLVDRDIFVATAAAAGFSGTIDELAAMCNLVELSGSLAVKATTAASAKAALLHMGRGASVSEFAALTGRHPKSVGIALRDTASCVRVGSNRWAVDTSDGTLSEFVEAARSCADDVGLIDEEALRSVAAKRAWGGRVDELIEACGFVRVTGQRLAVDATRGARLKAALVDLGRPATTAEIAAATGIDKSHTGSALAGIESVAHVGRSKWALKESLSETFHMAIRLCRDDVGLIDTAQLDAIAAEQGWYDSVEELIEMSGLSRISGRLSTSASLRARLKAALLNLGRPATYAEIAAEAEVTKRQAGALLASIKSLTRVGSKWAPKGLLSERFHMAIRLCRDDVGLIDTAQLDAIAAEQGWYDSVEELIEMSGLSRISGRLSTSASPNARLKAALLNLGRPATSAEIAAEAGATKQQAWARLGSIGSLTQVGSKWAPKESFGAG